MNSKLFLLLLCLIGLCFIARKYIYFLKGDVFWVGWFMVLNATFNNISAIS